MRTKLVSATIPPGKREVRVPRRPDFGEPLRGAVAGSAAKVTELFSTGADLVLRVDHPAPQGGLQAYMTVELQGGKQ